MTGHRGIIAAVSPAEVALPDLNILDAEALRALVIEKHTELLNSRSEIEKLQVMFSQLRRMQYGPSSERFASHIDQLELRLDDLEIARAANPAPTVAPGPAADQFRHEVLAVVLRVRGKSLQVLLWQRGAPPFEGRWSLPGGPLGASERLGTSASRHLAAKVDLTVIAHLEQLETRSDPERDPRGRVLATAYLALVSADVEPRIPADTAWHPATDLPPGNYAWGVFSFNSSCGVTAPSAGGLFVVQ